VHGFILSEIRGYVTAKLGAESWKVLLKEAGLAGKEYVNYREYPDEEVVALVVTASRITNLEVPAILEDFGVYLAANLMRIYRPLVRPEWKLLDFLEHVEDTVHGVVRSRNRAAHPPGLRAIREASDRVVVVYSSGRRLCALAVGIVQGLSAHYGEAIAVDHEPCQQRGAPACHIGVRVLPAGDRLAAEAATQSPQTPN
jgi:hypothetical protein